MSTWILKADVVVPHAPLVMLHSIMLAPNPKLVIVVFGEREFVIVPLPLITDHVPIPLVGVLAERVVEGEDIHNVWFDPAIALLGTRSICILIVDVLDPQMPLAIVHFKTFKPAPKPVTVLVSRVGVVILPLPKIIDHVPVPTRAVFPASTVVGELIHID